MAQAAEHLGIPDLGLERLGGANPSVARLSAAELERILDYSEALLSARDSDAFSMHLQSIADWLELDRMLVAYGRGRPDAESARILSVREHPGWMSYYMRERLYEIDPVLARAEAGAKCFSKERLLRFDSCENGLPTAQRIRARRLVNVAFDFRRAAHGLAGGIGISEKSKLFYTVVPQDRRQSHEDSRLAALLVRLMPSVHAGLTLLDVCDPLRNTRTCPELSPKERKTLVLLAEGCKDREIALRMQIVEATVRFYLKSIFAKLGAENRTHAVSIAHRLGLTGGES
jgi:DNA-binding CsgD family transcriptional regulator